MTVELRDLRGYSALVTGASGGIGAATAVELAKRGANLVLHGLHVDDGLLGARDKCLAEGVRTGVVTGDLAHADFDGIELVEAATSLEPGLSLYVNCAGAYFDVPFLQMTADRLDRTWGLNVRSAYLTSLALATYWVDQGVRGRIVFIGSINGQLSEPHSTAYDISKAAVHGMVRSLCVELAPLGIRVNGLAPGLIRTPATSWLDEHPSKAAWAEWHTPSRTIPGPEVCARGVAFLLTDDAEHVNGHVLNVDGGLAAIQFPGQPR